MTYEYSPSVMQWGAVLGASLIAAFTDLRSRRIPNALTLPLFVAGLLYAAQSGGWSAFSNAFLAGIVIGLPFVLLFAFAGGGAGDAKLMAAIGAWLGLHTGMLTLASVCITGAVVAVLHTCLRRNFVATMAHVVNFFRGLSLLPFGVSSVRDLSINLPKPTDSEKIPYGVSILLGTFIAAGMFSPWQV